VSQNFEKITTKEFVDKIKSLPGFLGVTDYAGGSTQAVLFDSQSNRNKAYKVLSEEIACAIIFETAYIPV
jgi:hypothetical protein